MKFISDNPITCLILSVALMFICFAVVMFLDIRAKDAEDRYVPTTEEIQQIAKRYGEEWRGVRYGDLLRNTDGTLYIFTRFFGYGSEEVEMVDLQPPTYVGQPHRVVKPINSRLYDWEIIPRGDGELPSEEWVKALDEHIQSLNPANSGN